MSPTLPFLDAQLISEALHDIDFRLTEFESIPAGLSPYAGGPSIEVDAAWHELLGNTSIRVSQEELLRNGNHHESVALQNQDGYMVWLGVYHQLHCMVSKVLRSVRLVAKLNAETIKTAKL